MVTIYVLRCTHTNQCYVGCTAGKIGKRMREHRSLLNHNKHSERVLQLLWNEYGNEGFRMETITTLAKDVDVIGKRKAEIEAMEYYESKGLLLNGNKASFSPPASAHSPEATRKAMRTRLKNGNRHITKESNLKRSLAQKGISHDYGHKISASKKGISPPTHPCPECGRQIAVSNMSRHVGKVKCIKDKYAKKWK